MSPNRALADAEALGDFTRAEIGPIGENNDAPLAQAETPYRIQYLRAWLRSRDGCGGPLLPSRSAHRGPPQVACLVEHRSMEVGPMVPDLGPVPGPHACQNSTGDDVTGIRRANQPGCEAGQVPRVFAVHLFRRLQPALVHTPTMPPTSPAGDTELDRGVLLRLRERTPARIRRSFSVDSPESGTYAQWAQPRGAANVQANGAPAPDALLPLLRRAPATWTPPRKPES